MRPSIRPEARIQGYIVEKLFREHFAAFVFIIVLLPTTRGRVLVWVDGVEPGEPSDQIGGSGQVAIGSRTVIAAAPGAGAGDPHVRLIHAAEASHGDLGMLVAGDVEAVTSTSPCVSWFMSLTWVIRRARPA